jgi:hypothetical protein
MKCGFCGKEFEQAEATTSCGACPLVRNCGLIRCPHCGYEMPPEPRLFQWLRKASAGRRTTDTNVSKEIRNDVR